MIWLYIISSIILLLIAIIDYETEEIPHTLTILLLICGIISVIVNRDNFILPLCASGGTFLLLTLMFFFGNIGGGDVKILSISCLFIYTLEYMVYYLMLFGFVLTFGLIKTYLQKKKSLRLGPYMAIPLILTFNVILNNSFIFEEILSIFLITIVIFIALDNLFFFKNKIEKYELFVTKKEIKND